DFHVTGVQTCALPIYANAGLLDFTRDDLMNGAEMAVTLLIALALMFFVLRPLLKKVMSPEPGPLALPAAVELGQNGTLDADGQEIGRASCRERVEDRS